MQVVPIKGDVITTADGPKFTVSSYTNFKSKGPAVYVEHNDGEASLLIYFFDIVEVNDVKVEFNNQSKILNALGYIKRKVHIPQKHDTIYVHDEEGNEQKLKVKELKLHNKNLGLSRGLLIIGNDDEVYSMRDIINIKRVSGDSWFDEKKFQSIYSDYLGYREKRKK